MNGLTGNSTTDFVLCDLSAHNNAKDLQHIFHVYFSRRKKRKKIIIYRSNKLKGAIRPTLVCVVRIRTHTRVRHGRRGENTSH